MPTHTLHALKITPSSPSATTCPFHFLSHYTAILVSFAISAKLPSTNLPPSSQLHFHFPSINSISRFFHNYVARPPHHHPRLHHSPDPPTLLQALHRPHLHHARPLSHPHGFPSVLFIPKYMFQSTTTTPTSPTLHSIFFSLFHIHFCASISPSPATHGLVWRLVKTLKTSAVARHNMSLA